jgi:UDP-N-acetylmuramyl pentapeptide phosphotransferase/UDP-N-acetylglucosamine-1-phosphate transferase
MPRMDYQPALAAFAASTVCILGLLTSFGRRLLLDRPNARSLHAQAVPRSGGIAIAAGVATGAVISPAGLGIVLMFAGLLAVVSLIDDIRELPPSARLAAHLAAAGAVLAWPLGISEPFAFLLLLLALAWSTNLYNFMDGADGLAGSMTIVGFCAYAIAAYQSGHFQLAGLCAAIAAAAVVFLSVNFPPAKIFMGDVGSVPIGFLTGAIGVAGWRDGAWPLWFPALVFAPFACDATLTLLKRLLRRERVWNAHREHYYQRLVQMGFGHRGTLAIEVLAMAACAGAALAMRDAAGMIQAGGIAAVAVGLAVIAAWIDVRWASHCRASRHAPV